MRIHPSSLHEPILGLVIGLVTDNSDPEGMYRIQVTYAVPDGDILSAWARVITLMAGKGMGWACIPEPDDEVLIRFVHGNPNMPVVVGSVHNGKDTPPFDNADGNNDLRIFHSRNLHMLELCDTDGEERISIYSTDSKTELDLLTADEVIAWHATKNIEIYCPSGLLTVEAGGDITLEAGSGWKSEAGSEQKWESDATVDISGSAGVAMTAPKIDYEA
jgi:uncharacterized protein involved in type VI secretion and phage assembly